PVPGVGEFPRDRQPDTAIAAGDQNGPSHVILLAPRCLFLPAPRLSARPDRPAVGTDSARSAPGLRRRDDHARESAPCSGSCSSTPRSQATPATRSGSPPTPAASCI